jgi:hypothetical protein
MDLWRLNTSETDQIGEPPSTLHINMHTVDECCA